ncbi:protein-glutamate methylesterase/protein-glutamine glutaminase [Rossellomorea vietnamensis]|jgi:two-component system, chemotaxis family, protein-glutamate methylesterase/glutaminase|uniref:Protein-glutamate methylesterase/protein-glutamine glutaminase n=1 Tax=Rossellomorea vietnamensis TaxID=218284 RepID=A0A6I6UNJ8_9BACI|nr:chemotaxis response regulator protein-glutamate methylesterase [Rossellomorea vietnamensis]OXS63237.1 chemotaxis response regulator protein-glutamate methylesterase [Bacillus sp. DSM 27956]PRX78199.1 two-component system chemotaxis response regulator CheB [Bacillus sp. V-88]QHE61309.1 chemotaxis-specific protein-glutamate methyltransferase CheB [Rossellomorea vietnamensis]SLK17223.1 two-component system, chemotaxis family, response regulator CheB [Bacillus sp. V-88]
MKKVLVVDDSAFMRKLISEFLTSSKQLEVIGIARNGEDAIAKIKRLRPDVVTLDVEMPKMNGIDALKRIMEECPVPVVMLSSTTIDGADETVKAMELGAVDFVAKPSGTISLDLHKIQDEMVEKVVAASKVNVAKITRAFQRESANDAGIGSVERTGKLPADRTWGVNSPKMILIGTSTGGPRALQNVLTGLPRQLDAPIVVVQHMPPGFTRSLANRLDGQASIHVKEAEHGEILEKGTAYIAPGGVHTKVVENGGQLSIQLSKEEPKNGHRPSVDILFESASLIRNYAKIAVVLTGMGADGSEGLVKLKEQGEVKAIAESRETCIVFGMPKSAIATELVDRVEHIGDIPRSIMTYMV